MPAVSRLGLYGGSRSPYGSFAGKEEGEVVVVASTGGRRRKKRYVVEVDGQFFDAENITAVQAALAQAREVAEDSVSQIVTSRIPRVTVKTSSGKPTTSVIIQREVRKTQDIIRDIYTKAAKSAAVDQEIAKLLKIKFDEEDEEEAIIALLLM